jgi:membrane-bound lytic murein transglycosylase D
MNLLRITSLATLVWLTGCAISPEAGDSAAPIAGETLDLRSSAEMRQPQSRANRPSTHSSASQSTLDPITLQKTPSRAVTALTPPVDLWDRIRRGYGMPDLDNDLVHDREQWYATRPDYIFRMTERSKKYLFHIVEELELRNMPTELALLPFIESAFNPQAVSGAKAAGMWQFMPATGKYFELKQNAFRDDRRDVLASTRAALDYLQKLHGMFGDWHLALAAYNWGEGSVGRAIAKNQRAGQAAGYPDLNMPMETRFYVPKLQAIKNIVSDPASFNSKLPLIENHPYFQSVTIRRDIDVALAAKLAEVPLDDFKALNPSINRPVVMAAGTPQILLPWDNAEVFQSNLESYGGGRLASWTVWVAPTTMRTADAAKRVGMTEAELRSVNAIPPRVVIKAGSSLLVTRTASTGQDVAVKVADNGQLSTAPEVVLKRVLVRAGKKDTVSSMARKHRVNADQLAQWNNVGISAGFKAGQQVIIYVPVNFQTGNGRSNKRATVAKSPVRQVVALGNNKGKPPAAKLAKR